MLCRVIIIFPIILLCGASTDSIIAKQALPISADLKPKIIQDHFISVL